MLFFVIFGRLSLRVAILSLPAIRDKRKAFYCRSGEWIKQENSRPTNLQRKPVAAYLISFRETLHLPTTWVDVMRPKRRLACLKPASQILIALYAYADKNVISIKANSCLCLCVFLRILCSLCSATFRESKPNSARPLDFHEGFIRRNRRPGPILSVNNICQ